MCYDYFGAAQLNGGPKSMWTSLLVQIAYAYSIVEVHGSSKYRTEEQFQTPCRMEVGNLFIKKCSAQGNESHMTNFPLVVHLAIILHNISIIPAVMFPK
jgi:hypothetical protein